MAIPIPIPARSRNRNQNSGPARQGRSMLLISIMLICLRARSYDEWHLILFCVKLRGCSWRGDLGILLLLLLLILMLMLMLSCGRMIIVRPFFGPTLKPLSAWFLVLWGRFVGPHVLQDQSEFESGSEYAPGFEMYLYLRCHDLALECHSTPCWLRLIKVGSCQLARRVDWSLSRCLHLILIDLFIFSSANLYIQFYNFSMYNMYIKIKLLN